MEQTILTDTQRAFLDFFRERRNLAEIFYLTGGTALAAFYLAHRYSDDLDFFTHEDLFPQLEVEQFAREVAETLHAGKTVYRRLYDRRIFFFEIGNEELKIEFTKYLSSQLNKAVDHHGLAVDSLDDIAANKVMALMDRIEPKDFVDLYFLMHDHGYTTASLRELVEKKFKLTLEPVTIGSEFAKVRHVVHLPKMIKLLSIKELKSFFMEQVRKLTPDIFYE